MDFIIYSHCFLSLVYLCCVTGAAKIIHVYEGGSVSISCPYESQDQNNMKYICRGNQPSSCLQQALITSNNRRNTQFSLTDDKESRKFTVTITSLTQKDSGSYLCGVKRNTGLDVFSAVDLEVRETQDWMFSLLLIWRSEVRGHSLNQTTGLKDD
uniref:Ig-like domain-containing protein n=1 Tax=Anabas testudineus TaxID=64144 RepID=A0A3Q1IUY8_ANATE